MLEYEQEKNSPEVKTDKKSSSFCDDIFGSLPTLDEKKNNGSNESLEVKREDVAPTDDQNKDDESSDVNDN